MIVHLVNGKVLDCDQVNILRDGKVQLLTMFDIGPWYRSELRALEEIVPLSDITSIDDSKFRVRVV